MIFARSSLDVFDLLGKQIDDAIVSPGYLTIVASMYVGYLAMVASIYVPGFVYVTMPSFIFNDFFPHFSAFLYYNYKNKVT